MRLGDKVLVTFHFYKPGETNRFAISDQVKRTGTIYRLNTDNDSAYVSVDWHRHDNQLVDKFQFNQFEAILMRSDCLEFIGYETRGTMTRPGDIREVR